TQQSSPTRRARQWTPRIWEGCDLFAWLRLLLRNRFDFSWRYLYVVLIVTWVSAIHTLLRYVQDAWYGSRVDRPRLPDDPIFILGHWRTGTTLLHELLIRDPRHTYPNYYQCLVPNHFLLTQGWFPRCVPFLMPPRRPMDNMAISWDSPQEDEFAL